MQQQILNPSHRNLRRRGRLVVLSLVSLSLALFSAGSAAASEVLGHVRSLSGSATAQSPGQSLRSLSVGDPVHVGDHVATAENSRVGLLLGDLSAQLGPDTRVSLSQTAESAPRATLEAGSVRMLDLRDGGSPAELAALDTLTQIQGNDAEAYILREKIGDYAMLCNWGSPIAVQRGNAPPVGAGPGDCVIAKPRQPLYSANAHDQRMPVGAGPDLGPQLASLNDDPTPHLSPLLTPPVGAPGSQPSPRFALGDLPTVPGPDRGCDVGPGGCLAGPAGAGTRAFTAVPGGAVVNGNLPGDTPPPF